MQKINQIIEKITFSIEKGHRFFNESEAYYNFLVVQFYISQEKLHHNSKYHLRLSKDNNILFSYDIIIDKDRKQVHSQNGLLFVDPLIESDNLYNITFHFPIDIWEKIKSLSTINVQFLDPNYNELMGKYIENISTIFGDAHSLFNKDNWNSKIIEENNKSYITSNKDCKLTLHLGSDNKSYKEEDYSLINNYKFDISHYIGKYSYLGIQCSFENIEPEVEEKYILIGLNGMSITGTLQTGKGKIHPIFDYEAKFQQQYSIGDNDICFIEVFSIGDLLSYYNHYRHKPIVFSCDYEFIVKHYTKNSTYNQNQLYSSKNPPLHSHTISETCKDCPLKSECLQIIPSGLSKELFKQNMLINDCTECKVYLLISSFK